jgi:type I restriction enzyme S subunit
MSKWKEYILKDLTTKIGSGATPTGGSNAYKMEGISLIRSQNVLDFKFSTDGLAFIDDEQAYDLRSVTVNKNDVLLNITGDSVARVCKVPDEVLPARVNQHVAIIRADESKTCSDFLLYNLLFLKEYLLSYSEIGGTRNALTKSMIENLEMKLPPLPIQKSISEILSSLDDKIDLLHRQNKTLEQLAETLFRQWFVEEAEESWEMKKVKDVCLTITKGTTPTTLGKPFKESGINFIKAESLTDEGTFVSEKFAFIDLDTDELLKRSKIQEGDILITIAGTIGRIGYVTKEILPANTNQAIGIMRADIKQISPFFLYCLFNTSEVKNDFDSRVVHAVQPNLSLGEIGDIEFKMPSQKKLLDGMKEIEPLFEKKNQNTNQIKTLTYLRDALLPKLMSGEVRVNSATEETSATHVVKKNFTTQKHK